MSSHQSTLMSPNKRADRGSASLLVVVGAPGAGKKTVTQNLAFELAWQGKDTLVLTDSGRVHDSLHAAAKREAERITLECLVQGPAQKKWNADIKRTLAQAEKKRDFILLLGQHAADPFKLPSFGSASSVLLIHDAPREDISAVYGRMKTLSELPGWREKPRGTKMHIRLVVNKASSFADALHRFQKVKQTMAELDLPLQIDLLGPAYAGEPVQQAAAAGLPVSLVFPDSVHRGAFAYMASKIIDSRAATL